MTDRAWHEEFDRIARESGMMDRAAAEEFDRIAREPEMNDRAWHEAGHAVASLVLGIRVKHMYVLPHYEPEGGKVTPYEEDMEGLAQADPQQHIRTFWLVELAGDAVDLRRVVRGARHQQAFLETLIATNPARSRPEIFKVFFLWLSEAVDLVQAHWLAISRLAEALLARPDRSLHALQLEDLVELERPK